jgi:SynChlorMet cassette protein ScmC
MRCSLHSIHQESIYRGGLPLHAALIELDGRGVLLAANSGTGKTTCCSRLPNHWKVLCDDESLIVLNQQRKYRVHPLPTWSDYIWKRAKGTWDTQYSVPFSGIFFLEQSEVDEAIPIEQWEAALLINGSAIQLCWKYLDRLDQEAQRELKKELLDNACAVANTIPAFRLRVSLQGQFWKNIEDAICL